MNTGIYADEEKKNSHIKTTEDAINHINNVFSNINIRKDLFNFSTVKSFKVITVDNVKCELSIMYYYGYIKFHILHGEHDDYGFTSKNINSIDLNEFLEAFEEFKELYQIYVTKKVKEIENFFNKF